MLLQTAQTRIVDRGVSPSSHALLGKLVKDNWERCQIEIVKNAMQYKGGQIFKWGQKEKTLKEKTLKEIMDALN